MPAPFDGDDTEPSAIQRATRDSKWDLALPFDGGCEEEVSEFIQHIEVVVVTKYPDGMVTFDTSCDVDDETVVYMLSRAMFQVHQGVEHLLRGTYDDDDEDEDGTDDEEGDEEGGGAEEAGV